MSNQPVHVLLNPASGGGRALRRWQQVESQAGDVLAPLAVQVSSRAGELEAIARALRDTDTVVVAAGGDGTSHEVVNGLLGAPGSPPPRAILAWLPLGSGNDLARSAGVPGRTGAGLELIRRRPTRPIDAGRISYRGPAGPATRVFGNSLTAGLSGQVLDRVSRGGIGGGRAAYGVAAVRALIGGQPPPIAGEADGQAVFDASTWLVSITNGAYFGAGMLAAPGARIDDGRLHLVTVDPLSRLRALALFPRVYGGHHLSHPAVTRHAMVRARITSARPLDLEIDGERLTVSSPIEVTLLRAALTAVVGPP
jgi:diacylglycerol kinase family enzyme